jgi:hypothetical protein
MLARPRFHLSFRAALACAALLSAGPPGCASADKCPPAAPPSTAPVSAAAPSAPAPVYRLEYELTSERPGGTPTSDSYALSVEDHGAGSLHVETNMPVAPAARAEVGLGLKASVESAGDAISLHSIAELSVVADPPAIDKASADTTTVVTPGKETPVAVLEDAASHRKYRLAVTATKLR